MSKKLVGFGELLLRLDTPGFDRFSQADGFRARFTGGEANVCVAAKRFGVERCFIVSRVPDQAIGHACLESLARYGVDTSFVNLGGERLGILFVENGVSVRPSSVVYDRLNTGFREATNQEYDWKQILDGADVLHVSGTAPALGESVRCQLDQAIVAAKETGCLVSFDCSYRSALWSTEEAGQAYRRLAKDVDILFATPDDARLFFGIEGSDPKQAIAVLSGEYGIKQIAYTCREIESASVNSLSGVWFSDDSFFESRKHRFEIVDRIGSGDAFAAGVLTGLLGDWEKQETVEFATAAGAIKHTIPGDFCLVTADEVRALANASSLRIRR